MLRRALGSVAAGSLLAVGVVVAPPAPAAATAAATAAAPLQLHRGEVDAAALATLREQHADVVAMAPADRPDRVVVDVVADAAAVEAMRADGVVLRAVVGTAPAAGVAAAAADAAEPDATTTAPEREAAADESVAGEGGDGDAAFGAAASASATPLPRATPTPVGPAPASVWRPWSGPGGLAEEVRDLAAAHPDLAELVTIGQSVLGQDIVAVRVTSDVARTPSGRRPVVLSTSLQHAREWIGGEVNRRLLRHVLAGHGRDEQVTDLLDTTELWFVLATNPDGYDHSFLEGQRLWRKNLADNDGDGVLTFADGVDLNRNFPTRWGYDDEGSSPFPGTPTYRGPAPASEPETRALDGLLAEQDVVFHLDWHSAGELLLHGVGWQVATPSPDDVLAAVLNGTDDAPAVPGHDPDLAAELYTANGTASDHAATVHDTVTYTVELASCEAAEDLLPDDAYGDDHCESTGSSLFEFPDDEALVAAVFAQHLPYALSVASAATDPYAPDTSATTGLAPPDFVVDAFDVSRGSPQPVAVLARRELRDLRIHWTINGGPVRTGFAAPWRGGERYGDSHDTWYGEYRGSVRGAERGDEVNVWFTARPAPGRDVPGPYGDRVKSDSFTYVQDGDSNATALVLADEDHRGFGPAQDLDAPRYLDVHADALAAAGVSHDTWDVVSRGVPHPLGVLGHYDLLVWERGENRLTQEAGDVGTVTPSTVLPDLSVAPAQQELTLAVRDFLNEGGKVVQGGEWAGYHGRFAAALGGAYYALDGDPSADCVITESFFTDCLLWSDDFAQYYQGVAGRQAFGPPAQVRGVDVPLDGRTVAVDGAQVPRSGAFTVTQELAPPADAAWSAAWPAARYDDDVPLGTEPFSGAHYVAAVHGDGVWTRLARTVDLGTASSASLAAKLAVNVEDGYDHVVVEARPVGTEAWTTLPDVATADGGTGDGPPEQCADGFLLATHPALTRYLTAGDPCLATGATGAWHAFTGTTGGWTDVEVDLTPYAGRQVEVAVSLVTDSGTGEVGAFLDDTVLTVDGAVVDRDDFEVGLGPWTVLGAPAGSPGNVSQWQRSTVLFDAPIAAVSTQDTVTFAFGLEAIATPEKRAAVLGRAVDHLLSSP